MIVACHLPPAHTVWYCGSGAIIAITVEPQHSPRSESHQEPWLHRTPATSSILSYTPSHQLYGKFVFAQFGLSLSTDYLHPYSYSYPLHTSIIGTRPDISRSLGISAIADIKAADSTWMKFSFQFSMHTFPMIKTCCRNQKEWRNVWRAILLNSPRHSVLICHHRQTLVKLLCRWKIEQISNITVAINQFSVVFMVITILVWVKPDCGSPSVWPSARLQGSRWISGCLPLHLFSPFCAP